jgi:hypothetical protein
MKGCPPTITSYSSLRVGYCFANHAVQSCRAIGLLALESLRFADAVPAPRTAISVDHVIFCVLHRFCLSRWHESWSIFGLPSRVHLSLTFAAAAF